jgi:hypothetical protein
MQKFQNSEFFQDFQKKNSQEYSENEVQDQQFKSE